MTFLDRHPWLGIAYIVAVPMSFACNTALASVAYGDGATAFSVLTTRTAMACIALFILLKLLGISVVLPPAKRYAALAMGVMLGTYSYGLLGAIQYMPLALAVITFYIYPLLVGVAAWALGYEKMTWVLGGSLLVAFVGLGLALDVFGGTLSPIGFALAAGGAVLNTILGLINSRLVGRGGDSRAFSLHMLSTATLTYVVADFVIGGFPLPHSTLGFVTFFGVGVFYGFSIVGIFVVISWLGPARAALTQNIEPITSVFIGTVLLHQAMKPTQLLGAGLVVSAILFSAWYKARRRT
jgi:drug/metabolite transporter (DMT)-like permease